MLRLVKRKEAKLLAAVAAAGLMLTPAFASTSTKKRAPAVSLSFDPVASFTPANADPKLAAALSEALEDRAEAQRRVARARSVLAESFTVEKQAHAWLQAVNAAIDAKPTPRAEAPGLR